jgi:hypothetical protein
VTTVAALDIDSNGFGTYKVTLTRGEVPDGTYTGSILAELSDETQTNVTFTYSSGAERPSPEVGYVLAYLYDDNGDYYRGYELQIQEGGIRFTVSNIDIGSYYWLFSTNIDADNYIRGSGEIWEQYPELNSQDTYFTLVDQDIEAKSVFIKTRSSYDSLSASSAPFDFKEVKSVPIPLTTKSNLTIIEN